MIQYYAQIKLLHIGAVIASGSLFLLRGLLMLTASDLGMLPPVRFIRDVVDTVLLLTAVALVAMLDGRPLLELWLEVKILLLPIYILLGTMALNRGRNYQIRGLNFLAALIIYGFIVSVALLHHPLGALNDLLSKSGSG